MALVGPGAIQQNEIAPSPTLEGASEYEFVTILNPLSDDFAVRVAQDIPVNMPVEIRAKTGMIQGSNDVIRSYGLDLKNPEFQSRKHIINDTIIKAGQTINLKGSEAQVAVRQLVNEMLQRQGNSRLMVDPNLRKEAEDKIILRRGSIQELMDQGIQSTRSQIDAAITQSNEVKDEQPFAGFSQPSEIGRGSEAAQVDTGNSDSSQPKRVGRPKKADS